MKRLFFAIPLAGDRKHQLIHSFKEKNFHGIRWVDEKNLHITLHFVGPVAEEKIPEMIRKAGTICSSCGPFELTFEAFKAVYKGRKPVMIWAQFKESEQFVNLSYQLREAFPTIENRKPLSHLTMARIRQLHQLPFELPQVPSFSIEVDILELWESHLHSNGAEYEMMERWKLKG